VAPVTALTDEQRETLSQLAQLWEGTRYCLIGATALACQMDFRRQTNDLDISVAVSLDDLSHRLRTAEGWTRHRTKEHEWRSPAGIKVDVLPAADELLEAGAVEWPESGTRMSLVGFRLALARPIPLEIVPGVLVPVAPVAVIALLKMVAYLDRPHERERDLEDLAFLFEEYAAEDDERRYSSEVIHAGLRFETASAFLLGWDLGHLINSKERDSVEGFIMRVMDEKDPTATQGRMARLGPPAWEGDADQLLARAGAFRAGLLGAFSRPPGVQMARAEGDT
jgi:predicted nucleotidyltransferase